MGKVLLHHLLLGLAAYSSLLTPHSLLLTPCSLLLTPHSLLLTPLSLLLTPHSLLLTPYSSLLTPHFFNMSKAAPATNPAELRRWLRPERPSGEPRPALYAVGFQEAAYVPVLGEPPALEQPG